MGICFSKSSTSPRHATYDREESTREPAAADFENGVSALSVSLGTPPERLRWGVDGPLEQHQIQQAAYHMGAFVVGDKVTSPRRLAKAGQTVHDVRLLLKHGRGNVKADDNPSHGHNGIGSSVAMRGLTGENKLARAVVMGAAVCDQTAPLCAIVHAPHMAANERSTTYGGTFTLKQINDQGAEIPVMADHTWSELWRESRSPTSTVVMDAWANGPAVRLKDSAWSQEPATEGPWSMDKSYAEFLKKRVEGLIPDLHPLIDDDVSRDLRIRRDAPMSWNKYAEAQVISPEFAKSVRKTLSRFPKEEKMEIASRMIRETYGMDPNQKAVKSVLVAANRLDSLPRPPVSPSEYTTARGSNRPVPEPRGAGIDEDTAPRQRTRARGGRV
ncbi:hypothetical protein Rleg10DRAFT_3507 [Rhizobium leguminosarum bv. trifolii WSM2012]|nr:hypothetical protein Rleg10DRAFT_3507 [Rhizobium leguminosarum bv. trifolii WSM2012]